MLKSIIDAWEQDAHSYTVMDDDTLMKALEEQRTRMNGKGYNGLKDYFIYHTIEGELHERGLLK